MPLAIKIIGGIVAVPIVVVAVIAYHAVKHDRDVYASRDRQW